MSEDTTTGEYLQYVVWANIISFNLRWNSQSVCKINPTFTYGTRFLSSWTDKLVFDTETNNSQKFWYDIFCNTKSVTQCHELGAGLQWMVKVTEQSSSSLLSSRVNVFTGHDSCVIPSWQVTDLTYRSKDPTTSIKVLKEQIEHRQTQHTIIRHEHKTQQVP